MNIKILYDAEPAYEGLKFGWGFSCLIDGQLLFDTGEDGDSLRHNLKTMAVDMSCIDTVVISHDHWDHVGGLDYVVQNAGHLKKIYICPAFDPVFKQKVASFPVRMIEANHFTRITNCIYSTGQMVCSYKDQPLAEQALILQTDKGFSVLTGCAHPGIIAILEKIKSQLSLKEFYTVIGGFHLKNHTPAEIEKIVQKCVALKVRRVAPLHCTGSDAQNIFKKAYGDRCFMLKIGDQLEV